MDAKAARVREFKQLSPLEHVRERASMYIGSTECVTDTIYTLDSDARFKLTEVSYSPALINIVNEIAVNAIDHWITYPDEVHNISVAYENGVISICNDGPCIPITKVTNLDGKAMYLPQAIFSEPLSGDNFKDDRKTGGCNGIGAKACNCFSEYLTLETYDAKTGTHYMQTFRDQLRMVEPPILSKGKAHGKTSFTRITFLPTYNKLGYMNVSALDDGGRMISKLIEAIAYQIAVYTSCTVTYNGTPLPQMSLKTFAGMFVDTPIYSTCLSPKEYPSWDVCVAASDDKFRHVSVVNGLWIRKGGSHINYLKKYIVRIVTNKLIQQKLITKDDKVASTIANCIFIFMRGTIVDTQFNSQTKESIQKDDKYFTAYTFTVADVRNIYDILEPRIRSTLLNKMKDKKKTRVKRGKVVLDKGEDAVYAGHRTKAKDTSLIICEGDSALTMVTCGITSNMTALSKEYFGTFSIQGVPMNARKQCKEFEDIAADETVVIRNDKLKNNKRIGDLVHILGLDYEKKYDTDEELATLRYGRVVVAVDQDEDGKGHIFGLLINFFMMFWPNLIKLNYVCRFNTPIVRIYKKGSKTPIKEFFNIMAFHKYEEQHAIDESKYLVKYYKGLARHDTHEVPMCFVDFEDRIFKYNLDEHAPVNIIKYYGKMTKDRKEELRTCVSMNDDSNASAATVTVTHLLRTDVKEFHRDNILRKLPHVVDGMVPSRRKAFYTGRRLFSKTNEEIKVCQFTGDVMSKTNYHHGDATLSKTIIKMAQSFVGAKNMPLFIGVGQFGSRAEGGNDFGSPRYICIKLNKRLSDAMYPRVDDCLLKYTFDGGKQYEPLYYVPIIPTSVMEYMSAPATGWKVQIWPRDYVDVFNNVIRMVSTNNHRCKYLRVWLRGNRSELRYCNDGCTYVVGKYIRSKDTVTITELPPTVYNNAYIKQMTQNVKDKTLLDHVKTYVDMSNYDHETNVETIDIKIEFKAGVLDGINETCSEDELFSDMEMFLKLSKRIQSNINMIRPDQNIHEYTKYSQVVEEWFIERKQLYIKRINREIQLIRIQILYYSLLVKFIENYNTTYGIDANKCTEEDVVSKLRQYKYERIDLKRLKSPADIATEDLYSSIINSSTASYEYILSLNFRQLLKKEYERLKAKLHDTKEKLSTLCEDYVDCDEDGQRFTGQKAWLRELGILREVIEDGLRHGWKR